MKVETTCDYCGKIFMKEEKQINYNHKHGLKVLCSRGCVAKSKLRGEKVKCFKCGKEIYRKPSDKLKNTSGNFFCSKSCANSYHNTIYKTVDGAFNGYRQKALEHYGPKCFLCDYDVEPALEVHHIDGNRKHNNLSNLVVLCPNHHKEVGLGLRNLV
jgi:hypothetical protein